MELNCRTPSWCDRELARCGEDPPPTCWVTRRVRGVSVLCECGRRVKVMGTRRKSPGQKDTVGETGVFPT